MRVFADVLRDHLGYNFWADRRLLDAAAHLPGEELTRDFRTADHSVLGTLVHLYASERLWLARLQGGPHPAYVTDADRDLTVLQNDWPALHERWRVWALKLTDEDAARQVSYTDMKGTPWNQPLWKLVLHIVNHGTHHRGQVSGFLRALGRTPPPLDLVLYYREREKS
jgi:uncharacterized damage-inducible protein DinB